MANEPVILNVYDMVSLHQSLSKGNPLFPCFFGEYILAGDKTAVEGVSATRRRRRSR